MVGIVRRLNTGVSYPAGDAAPSAVRLMRERRGYTRSFVAESIGRQPQWASRVESGQLKLNGPALLDMASVLNVPAEFLLDPVEPAALAGTHFRTYRVPKRTEDRVAAEANFTSTILKRLLDALDAPSTPSVPRFDGADLGATPEESGRHAATLVRQAWGLGEGPVDNLVGRIERAGVFYAQLPADLKKVGAITVDAHAGLPAVTLLSRAPSVATQRFTAAHELAHLVLDASSTPQANDHAERRAHAFAGELLAPYAQVREIVSTLNLGKLDQLLYLHRTWGMHPKAFIERGYQAGDISANARRRWYAYLNGQARSTIARARCPYSVRFVGVTRLLEPFKQAGWTTASLANYLKINHTDLTNLVGTWSFTPPAVQPATVPDTERPVRHLVLQG